MMSRLAPAESARAISTSCCCDKLRSEIVTRGSTSRLTCASRSREAARIARRSSQPARAGIRPMRRFSATLSVGSTASSWWITAIPAACDCAGGAELRRVRLGDHVGAGEEPSVRRELTRDQVVIQAYRRVMSLRIGVLPDGRVDDAFLDVVHRLVYCVEGHQMHLPRLADLLD